MIKKLFTVGIIFLLIFIGIYFYFFCFYIRIVNKSKAFDINQFKCESTFGEEWDFGKIERGKAVNKIITLSHGSAVSCTASIKGYEPKPTLVVGYFNEHASNIEIVVEDSESGIDIKLNELNF